MTSTVFQSGTVIDSVWLNDVDALVYQGQLDNGTTGASISRYLPAGTGAVATTVQAKLRESVSVKDFGAVGDGVTDDSAAFSAAWAYIKTTYENPAANLVNVTASLVVPPGKYLINTSVNWTGGGTTTFLAWNIHVQMRGAVLIAGAGCSGRAMIDATSVRGLHLEGGYIESVLAAGTAPLCGILVGNSSTNTCGNNNFRDVQIGGVFTLAPFVNIGSETTCYYNCYFMQTNTDTSTFAYVGDGLNSRAAVVSLYTTLRANNTAVSLTNNKFYACHFRNNGGGSSVYFSFTLDWEIDSGCYILAFGKSNVELYQSGPWRNGNLTLRGLYETSIGAGVDYMVTFLVPNGETSGLTNLTIDTAAPHASDSVFNVTTPAGGVTTGAMVLKQLKLRMAGPSGGGVLFNVASGKSLTANGQILFSNSAQLNLYDCGKFVGIVQTDNGSLISGTAGASVFNYTLIDPTTYNGQVLAVSKGPDSYLGVQNGVYPVLRGEGTAADVDIALQGKGAGHVRYGTRVASADVPITRYIEIKDLAGSVRKLAVIA